MLCMNCQIRNPNFWDMDFETSKFLLSLSRNWVGRINSPHTTAERRNNGQFWLPGWNIEFWFPCHYSYISTFVYFSFLCFHLILWVFLDQCHLACLFCVPLVCSFIGQLAPSAVDIWHDQFRPDAKLFVWPLCKFSHVCFLTQTTLCCLVKFVYFIKLISFTWSVIWLLWNKVGGTALLGPFETQILSLAFYY